MKKTRFIASLTLLSLLMLMALVGCSNDNLVNQDYNEELNQTEAFSDDDGQVHCEGDEQIVESDDNNQSTRPLSRRERLTERPTFDWDSYEPGERPDYAILVGLYHPTDLTYLSIPSNGITSEGSVLQLRHFTDLVELRLWNNDIDNIRALSFLENLEILSLGANQISDLTPLSNLTNLTILKLGDNEISDISPLAELTNLEWLILSNNQISDLSPLAELTNLRILELCDNEISDLSPLGSLANLEELTLADNQVSDVYPLLNLANLSYVCLRDNTAVMPPDFLPTDTANRTSLEVGDTLEFGDFSWIVLDIQDDHALIITEYIHLLGRGQFHNMWVPMSWDNSTMRLYLNNEFLNGFRPSDREFIRETLIINERNPWFGIYGGSNTMDRVFLLSIREVVQYFGDSGALAVGPYDWTVTYLSDEYDCARRGYFEDGGSYFSWLRSPGGKPILIAGVDGAGAIFMYGTSVTQLTPTVRPVLWLSLVSDCESRM